MSSYGLACCNSTTAIAQIKDVEGALARESAAFREVMRLIYEREDR